MVTSEIDKSSASDNMESSQHVEKDTSGAAEEGVAATDRYGASLVHFDAKAEARLRTKLDLYVLPTVAVLYLFCFIDRANIGNAKLAGLEADLGMTGPYAYNQLLSIFYISYILCEIPSNLACKWLGPGWFLPATSALFGVASLCTAFVHNLPQACGVRFVLGIFEAGMMPGISYYLSRWYRRSELAFRLALFLVMAPLAGAFGGLLASGILTLSHFGSLHRWRMIFAIEGILTISLSLIAFFTLTDRPETARFLSRAEKDLAAARLKSERVAQTAVLDRIDRAKLVRGFGNPAVLLTAFVFFLNNVTVQGLAFFAPTIVATIYPDASTIEKQLHTVPPYVVGAFFTLLLPYLSWKTDRRQIFMILSTPLVIAGYAMFLGTTDPTARYAAVFLLTSSCMAMGPLTNAQAAAQTVSDTSRSVAIGTNVMFGNIGGLISTWSYLGWDGPNYHIGNGLNLACAVAIGISSTATLLWMHWDNRRRDAKGDAYVDDYLRGLTPEQTASLEWRHPAWRWKP